MSLVKIEGLPERCKAALDLEILDPVNRISVNSRYEYKIND